MRRFAFLVFVVACHSREQQQAAPVASVSETLASAAPIASAAPVVSAGTITVDAGKRDDEEAARRAKLEREVEAKQLQILAVLGAHGDAGYPALRAEGPPSDALINAASSEHHGENGLVVGTGKNGGAVVRGGGIADLRDTRDH